MATFSVTSGKTTKEMAQAPIPLQTVTAMRENGKPTRKMAAGFTVTLTAQSSTVSAKKI
jgi:hypothetical protein